MKPGIKIYAPATVANVAVGFDALGFALEQPGEEIIARLIDKPGITISRISGVPKGKISFDPDKNTAGVAAQALLQHLGEDKVGIEFEIIKKWPIGSGLGSSAASAAAAVVAVNELLHRPILQKKDLLPFAVQGEQIASGAYHADNVAPALLGGMIFIRDNASLDIHRLPLPKGLFATVILPEVEVLTKEARKVLSNQVDLKNSLQQSNNFAAFMVAMYNANYELMGRALNDSIIESQRAHLIPHFYDIQKAALENGALGCSISGAGPAIFALSNNSLKAEAITEAMSKVYTDHKIEFKIYNSRINQEGTLKF